MTGQDSHDPLLSIATAGHQAPAESRFHSPQRRFLLLGAIGLGLALSCCTLLSVLNLIPFKSVLLKPEGQILNSSLPVELQWIYKANGNISIPPWYHGGVVLVRVNRSSQALLGDIQPNSAIEAVDAETGRRIWRFSRDAIGVRRELYQDLDAAGGVVVVTYLQGAMSALDLRTGVTQWQREPDVAAGIAVDENKLYIGGYGQVRAYDLRSGMWLWEMNLQDEALVGLTLNHGQLYAFARRIWILDPDTGEVETALSRPFASRAVLLINGTVVALGECDDPRQLVAYDAGTGEQLWASEGRIDTQHQRVNVVGEAVFFRTDHGTLDALNVRSGKSLWEYQPEANAEVISGVAVLDDLAYFILSDGTLRAVNIQTGDEVGYLQSSSIRSWHNAKMGESISVPGVAASEGMLFVSFGGRTLYAFKPTD